MKFSLEKQFIELAKTVAFDDLKARPIYYEENGVSIMMVDDDDLDDMLTDITYQITLRGMDAEQNNVTAYGRELYHLYDKLLYQMDQEFE